MLHTEVAGGLLMRFVTANGICNTFPSPFGYRATQILDVLKANWTVSCTMAHEGPLLSG